MKQISPEQMSPEQVSPPGRPVEQCNASPIVRDKCQPDWARTTGLRTLHLAEDSSRIGAPRTGASVQGAAVMFGKTKAVAGPRKCAHPACFCTVEGNDKFCSSRCRDARGMTELHCQCCHAGCECGPAS